MSCIATAFFVDWGYEPSHFVEILAVQQVHRGIHQNLTFTLTQDGQDQACESKQLHVLINDGCDLQQQGQIQTQTVQLLLRTLMRIHSKSPLGDRIDAITQRVEMAIQDLPALRKLCKEKSAHRLDLPRHPDHSKATAEFGVQKTDRSKPSSESGMKLQFKNIKIHQLNTQPSSQRTIENQPISATKGFKHIRSKIQDLDLTKLQSPQNLTPINKFSHSSKNLNFRSLSNLNIDFKSVCKREGDTSPVHVDLNLVEVTSHRGYHQAPTQASEKKRIIIGQELKHKVASMIKKRVEQNRDLSNVKKHTRDNSCIKLRDTLVKRVANIAGLLP